VADIGQDLRDHNDPTAARLAGDLEDELEPEDVEALTEELADVIRRSRPTNSVTEDRLERLKHVHGRLRRVVQAGAGLTSRHTDDIDA
jgi:hypothetical protein